MSRETIISENSGRPTVHDIARRAGVSLATVDRVLNQRSGVRAKTIARVHEAISSIGYVRDVSAANLARQRNYDFVFLLPDVESEFMDDLRGAILETTRGQSIERVSIRLLDYPADDTYALASALAELGSVPPDGIAIMAPETPLVRDAVRHLVQLGVTIVPVISDLPNSGRNRFIGINNIAAGRTAAQLMGRFLGPAPATIMVVAGSINSYDQAERRLGFDAVMQAEFSQHFVLPTLEAHDRSQMAESRILASLRHNPGISAVYAISASNHGLINALDAARGGCRRTVIAHELTQGARSALANRIFDAVIAQNTGHIVRSAIRTLKAEADGLSTIESQERIRIDIFIAENLPDI